jgi:hypothetical protein
MTALHNTLDSIYNTQLTNPTITIPPPHHFDTYSPHSAGIDHLPPNPTQPITYPLPERTTMTYSPTRGELAWKWQDPVYTDGSMKGVPSPLGEAATHPASDTHIICLVTSTTPSHTLNRAELSGIDIGLQLGHTQPLTFSACSLRLI